MDDMNGLIAFYGTVDLAATKQFYGDWLGFPLLKDQGSCLIFGVPGGGSLGFCSHMAVPTPAASLFITYVTQDVEMVSAWLVRHGAVLVKEPVLNERFGIFQSLFLDPNGYTFEVQRFL